MAVETMNLVISNDDADVAYLFLPGHPGAGTRGSVASQKCLSDILRYSGADLYLDFDEGGRLIGVEILA